MKRREHVTERGSRVRPVGQSSWEVMFEWFEEDACFEAVPVVDCNDAILTWSCECCDVAGEAKLKERRRGSDHRRGEAPAE